MKTVIIALSGIFFISCNSSFFDKPQLVTFTNTVVDKEKEGTVLVYIDETNTKKTVVMTQSQKDHFTLSLKKNHLTPVLVYTSQIDAEPRGCIYPLSTTITTHNGFAAWILYRLLQATHNDSISAHSYLSHFNWRRFSSYIKKFQNPWVLNQDLILENIADKTFNVYSIKVK